MFTVTGRFDSDAADIERAVTWQNGTLSGDEPAIELVRLELELLGKGDGVPVANYRTPARLENPLAVHRVLVDRVFATVVSEVGKIPTPHDPGRPPADDPTRPGPVA